MPDRVDGTTDRRLWYLARPNCFADWWLLDSQSHDCPRGGPLEHLLRFRSRSGVTSLWRFVLPDLGPDPRYLDSWDRTLPDYKGAGRTLFVPDPSQFVFGEKGG